MVKWNKKTDNAKLFELFNTREDRDGLDYRKRSKEYIEAARAEHFPKMKNKNFSVIYNTKASKVDIDEKLKNARARKGKLCCL